MYTTVSTYFSFLDDCPLSFGQQTRSNTRVDTEAANSIKL